MSAALIVVRAFEYCAARVVVLSAVGAQCADGGARNDGHRGVRQLVRDHPTQPFGLYRLTFVCASGGCIPNIKTRTRSNARPRNPTVPTRSSTRRSRSSTRLSTRLSTRHAPHGRVRRAPSSTPVPAEIWRARRWKEKRRNVDRRARTLAVHGRHRTRVGRSRTLCVFECGAEVVRVPRRGVSVFFLFPPHA